jgi:hypothetical protein
MVTANGHVGSGIGNGIGIDPVAVAMRSATHQTELAHSRPGGRAMHVIVLTIYPRTEARCAQCA